MSSQIPLGPKYKLAPWIVKKRIDWNYFSKNPNDKAIDILMENPKRINWRFFLQNENPRVLKIIKSINFEYQNYRNNIWWSGIYKDGELFPCESLRYNKSYEIIDILFTKFYLEEKSFGIYLSDNPHDKAVEYLIKNPGIIIWEKFSKNQNDKAVDYLIKNPDKINWSSFFLNENEKAVDFSLEQKDRHNDENVFIHFQRNKNSKAVKFLIDKYRNSQIKLSAFFSNPTDLAVDLIEEICNTKHFEYPEKYYLCCNTNSRVIKILEENPELINIDALKSNTSDRAVDLLLKSLNEIDFRYNYSLADNPNPKIIEVYKKNPKAMIANAYAHDYIFELDYQAIKKAMSPLKKELMSVALHPRRIERIIKMEQERLVGLGLDPESYDLEKLI